MSHVTTCSQQAGKTAERLGCLHLIVVYYKDPTIVRTMLENVLILADFT